MDKDKRQISHIRRIPNKVCKYSIPKKLEYDFQILKYEQCRDTFSQIVQHDQLDHEPGVKVNINSVNSFWYYIHLIWCDEKPIILLKSQGYHRLGGFSKISDKYPQNCQDNKNQEKSQLREA